MAQRAFTSPLVILAAIGLLLIGAPAGASSKPNGSKLQLHSIDVDARIIRRFSQSGGRGDRFGRLTFRGGLVLTSRDAAFGGYSGLEISPDGENLLAVSDAGTWLKAKLNYAGGRPSHLSEATIGPIMAQSTRKLVRGRDRDAEAVRLFKGNLTTGTVLIGFEGNQRVGFFDLVDGNLKAPRRYLRPPVRLIRNKGIEATGVIRSGRFKGGIVAFAERSLDGNGHHRGWLWHRAKQTLLRETLHPLALTNENGFDITDVTGAFDGGLYILERRFRWSEGVKMRVRKIAPDSIKPGAVLTGETLIEADLGYEIDNMEGIAAHRDANKRTMLTLISDDNFNSFLQRTILLQFVVDK